MPIITSFLTGTILAAEFLIIYRSFFCVLNYPLFQLPVIYFLFLSGITAGYLSFENLNQKYENRLYSVVLALKAVYALFLPALILAEKPLLGFSFFAELPWYAVVLYPLIILFPMSFLTGLFLKITVKNKAPVISILFGVLVFLIADSAYLWKLNVIYAGFFLSAAICLKLTVNARKKLLRIKNALFFIAIVSAVSFGIPDKINYLVNRFERSSEKLKTAITPYGLLRADKNKNSMVFSLNHSKLMSYPSPKNVQEYVHMTMLQYPWAETVLALGGTTEVIKELLKYPNIKNIYWGNPVPEALDMIIEMTNFNTAEFDRVRVLKKSDMRAFIRKIRYENIFDIALISVSDPVNLFFNRFYTHEFFYEISTVLSENSMLALTINAGKKDMGINHQILSSTVYSTLKQTFPNTLEMYGKRSHILASASRNFTTAQPVLLEFLNVLEDGPSYISPSLINYKINSSKKVLDELIPAMASINQDTKPASLKYSLNELFLSFGIYSGGFLKFFSSLEPLLVYILVTVLAVLYILLFRKRKVERRLSVVNLSAAFTLIVFSYDLFIIMHSYSGRIYKLLSLMAGFITLGTIAGIKFLKKRMKELSLSYIKTFLMFSGVFFILIPTAFEITLTSPSPVFIYLFLAIGGFLINGIIYKITEIHSDFCPEGRQGRKHLHLAAGVAAGCFFAVLFIPSMGTIEVIPALGILSLSGVILLNI